MQICLTPIITPGFADSSNYYFRNIDCKGRRTGQCRRGRFAAYHYEQRISLMNKEKEIRAVQLQEQTLMKNILVGIIVLIYLPSC
jgi:hypothetical protein